MNEVLYLHDESLKRFGGSAGIREPGLVESALGSAQNTFNYGHGDLFEIAAAYAFHLAEAQAFLDGNKRTATASAIAFLTLNGIPISQDDGTMYVAMIEVAEKKKTKADLAAVFRRAAERKN